MNLVSVVLLAAVPAFFGTAVFGKNVFEVFMLQYLEWPLEKNRRTACLLTSS